MNTIPILPATSGQQSAMSNIRTDLVQNRQQITDKMTRQFLQQRIKTKAGSNLILQILSVIIALTITMLSGVAHATGCAPGSIIISQAALPYTISISNKSYCLISNLSFSGSPGQPAITINPAVNNDTINFNGFTLTLAQSQEVGIQMLGLTTANVSNIVVENGTIQSAATSSNASNDAVNLTESGSPNAAFKNVSFQNMNFLNEYNGLVAFNSSDSAVNLQVSNSNFSNIAGSGVLFQEIQGASVVNSSFSNSPGTAIVGNNGINLVFNKDSFYNNLQNIELDSGGNPSSGNVLVTASTFSSGANGTFQDFKSAGMSNVQLTYDVFNENTPTVPSPAAYLLAPITFAAETSGSPGASGLLIDHVTINSTNSIINGWTPYIAERLVQIGQELGKFSLLPIVGANNVTITNSTFNQTNANLIQGFPPAPGVPRGAAGIATDLLVFGVNGLLVANNTFTMNSTARLPGCATGFPYPNFEYWITGAPTPEPDTANIQLGTSYGDVNVKNVVILGNTIKGPDQAGIFSETGALASPNSNIAILGNNITGTEQGILFDNTTNSLISGNTISGVNGSLCFSNGTGIQLDGTLAYNPSASSSNNAILLNVVTKNQTGINIVNGALNNTLFGNIVTNNAVANIVNGN